MIIIIIIVKIINYILDGRRDACGRHTSLIYNFYFIPVMSARLFFFSPARVVIANYSRNIIPTSGYSLDITVTGVRAVFETYCCTRDRLNNRGIAVYRMIKIIGKRHG